MHGPLNVKWILQFSHFLVLNCPWITSHTFFIMCSLSFKCPSRCSRSPSGGPTAARVLRLGIRIRSGHGCLSLAWVMFCQVSETGRSLSQRRPTEKTHRGGLGLLGLSSHDKSLKYPPPPVSLTIYLNPNLYPSSSQAYYLPLPLRPITNKYKNKFCKTQSIAFRYKIWRCRKVSTVEKSQKLNAFVRTGFGLSTRDLKRNWRIWFTAFKRFFF